MLSSFPPHQRNQVTNSCCILLVLDISLVRYILTSKPSYRKGCGVAPSSTQVSILNRGTKDVSLRSYVCFMSQTAAAAFMSWVHPFIILPLKSFHAFFSFCKKPTFIFLCKVSASGVLQGSPSRTCLVIFLKFLGCSCS